MTTALPSIRQRITRTLLGLSLVWGGLVAGVLWGVVGHEIDELMDQGLRESGEALHSVLAATWPQVRSVEPEPMQDPSYEAHMVWQVVDTANGAVVLRSHLAPTTALLTPGHARPQASDDGRWRVLTIGKPLAPGVLFLIAQSEDERARARTEAVLFTLLGALVIGALSARLLDRRLRQELEPLTALSAAVQTHDPLQADQRLPAPQRAELAPMVQSIQGLGQRLAQRVASERAFTAHAAHALRTPLAGIDAQLAIALKQAPPELQARLVRTRAASNRLGLVMQALLAMFRSGREAQRQTVSLATLLTPWPAERLPVTTQGLETVDADPELLAAALMNLLDNATQHGATQATLQADGSASMGYRLRLQDNGSGCAPEQRAHLRQALQAHDHQPETGLRGLGLILADLVMQAHGGTVQLPDVPAGFAVELCWPSAAQTP